MPTTAFALLVLFGAAMYFMTAAERARLARSVFAGLMAAVRALTQPSSANDPFDEFLRTRTRWAVVTPLLVALNVLTFTLMVFDRGALSEAQTLIDWGGNFAPRTTNGEWWRLIAATFVHGGVVQLLATIAALLPLGLILERAVGRVAFATTYLAAGVLAGLVSLWTVSTTTVSFGATGAIVGVYGLLLASLVWTVVHPPAARIPAVTVKRLAAAAAPFFLYNLFTDHFGMPELAGLGTGVAGGLLIARGVTRERPALRRAAVVLATTGVIAIAAAVPLRGITDVTPDIAQVSVVEQRTSAAYDAAVGQFRLGRLPAKRLVQVIERSIIPDLQTVRTRLSALRGVPREQAPLIEAADKYLQLREASWRRRAEGLLRSNTGILRDADRMEGAALDAFRTLQPAG